MADVDCELFNVNSKKLHRVEILSSTLILIYYTQLERKTVDLSQFQDFNEY